MDFELVNWHQLLAYIAVANGFRFYKSISQSNAGNDTRVSVAFRLHLIIITPKETLVATC